MKIKNLLLAGLMMVLIGLTSCVGATANVAIDQASLSDQISSAFILEHSKPTLDKYEYSIIDSHQMGYMFTPIKNGLNLKQYTDDVVKVPFGTNTKVSLTDVVPYGVVVDYLDWEKYKSAVLSVEVDNCLDCALFEKTKDVYKLKEHLLSLRAFTSMVRTLQVRNDYALKQSAYDRLMRTDKKFVEARSKAQERGFKLCPVVPDDYTGLNLDSYIDKVQEHMNSVENKMKSALQ